MKKDDEKKPRPRIKKVKGHGDHHGGAWKVAYADFVTAMMALFLVLWLVSQADTKLKQAIANYFRSPGVFDTQEGGILAGPKQMSKEPSELSTKDEEQALIGTAAMLKKKFQQKPEFSKYSDQIRIEVTEQGLKIQIVDKAERVSFDSGRSDLTQAAKAILAEIAGAICQLPNPILIGGHTDRQQFPPNSPYTNWELSADRANAARRELEANCVSPEKVRRIVGYADTEPLTPDDPYATANRRISITVLRIHPAPGKPSPNPADGDPAEDVNESARAGERNGAPANPAASDATPNPADSAKRVSVGTADKLPENVPLIKAAPPAEKKH